jgi:hypothetical protein
MKETKVSALFRIVGLWDLALTLPFAVPGLNSFMIGLLGRTHALLGGKAEFPTFAPLHLFFVGLFGLMCVLWAAIRAHRPSRLLAAYDTAGRFVVATFMIATSLSGISPVPALFAVSEIGWGVAQGIALARSHSQS